MVDALVAPVKIVVVYHSGYGHTSRIAEAVARGAAAISGRRRTRTTPRYSPTPNPTTSRSAFQRARLKGLGPLGPGFPDILSSPTPRPFCPPSRARESEIAAFYADKRYGLHAYCLSKRGE